jgi:hypothetical protein
MSVDTDTITVDWSADRYESLGQSMNSSWPSSSGHPVVGAVYANSAVTTTSIDTGLYTGGYTFSNTIDSSFTNVKAGTLTLQGREADIEINGVSLMTVLQGIQERLNILQPNRTLEAEWHQLQELGEQYRALEAELLEKQRMWSQLSARCSKPD